MLTTSVFELVQQFSLATETGAVANAVSTCTAQPSRQNNGNCFG